MKQTYISFLRGINVGGHKKIPMKELAAMYQAAGLENVRTYIQSGNVIFKHTESQVQELQQTIESAISAYFKFDVSVIIRNIEEIKNILVNNPFLNEGNLDPTNLYLALLQAAPSQDSFASLSNDISTNDRFSISGKEIYIFCPEGFGNTKFNNQFFEKKLKTPSTIRNWRTMQEMLRISQEIG